MTHQVAENTTNSPLEIAEGMELRLEVFRNLGLALLAVVSFKVFLAMQIGVGVYQGAVASLAAGGVAEKAAAHLLMLDGVSLALINLMG